MPVSQRLDIPKSLGLRHRAALGITEKTDAIVIVVSEETGGVSYMQNGKAELDVTIEQLTRVLSGEDL